MSQLLCNESFLKAGLPAESGELISYAIENNLLSKLFLIFPTGKIVRKGKQNILKEYFEKYNKPLESTNVFTLQNFIRLINVQTFSQNRSRTISDAHRLAIFEEAVQNSELMFYKKCDGKVSYPVLQKLANVVWGLKEDGITPDKMKKRLNDYMAVNDGTLEVLKYGDIANLYSAYEIIKGDKLLDNEDVTAQVNHYYKINGSSENELFSRNSNELTKIFPSDSIIHFEGFSEFKFPETVFLSLFSNAEFPVSIRIDFLLNEKKSLENGPLFGNLEKTIIDLSDSGFKLIPLDVFTQKQKDELEEVLPSYFLRRWLFNTEKKIENEKFSFMVKIFECENRIEEVRTLAKLIKWLVLEKNYKLPEICVVMRQPEQYTTLFREIFQEYKIPVNISDRYKLSSSNVVNSIFAVLDLVINRFRREDVNKILNSQYLSLGHKENPENRINSTRLYDLAVQLRINGGIKSGGKNAWKKKMEFRLRSLENQLKYADDSAEEQPDKYSLQNEIKLIKEAVKDFASLENLVNFEDKMMFPDEFAAIIQDKIIVLFEIMNNINNIYKLQADNFSEKSLNEKILYAESVEKDVRALVEFEKILFEFKDILNERNPNTKYTLIELTEKLRTSMLNGKYQIREKQSYGVTVTSVEQIRNIDFKVSILCGALDGSFPISYRPEVFLGEEIPDTEERHICTERMQFYQFLTNSPLKLDKSEKLIYITYPQFDEDKELVRSPFVDAVLRITNLEQDNRIYNFADLKKAIELPESMLDEKSKIQLQDVPFINSIASDNEKYGYFGNKIHRKGNFDEIIASFNIISPANLNAMKFLRMTIDKSDTFSGLDWNLIEQNLNDEYNKIQDKVYSITELETYNKCPYMFFLNYLVKLPQTREVEYGLSALESGNLYHIILYRFYTKLKSGLLQNRVDNVYNSKKGLQPIISVELEQSNHSNYLNELSAIAIEELDKIRFEHPYFEFQENELLGTRDKMGELEIWLKCEYERRKNPPFSDFKPILFETGFGLINNFGENNLLPIELADGLRIRGKIDRIEWDEENSFIVADYKSSGNSLPSVTDIVEGNSFQIPFYMISAKKILSEFYGIEAEPKAGVYYILKPKYNSKNQKFDSDKTIKNSNTVTIDSLLNTSVEFALNIVKKIKNGDFPVEPKKDLKSCDYCSFANICHVNKMN